MTLDIHNKQTLARTALSAEQELFFQKSGIATVILRPSSRVVHPYAWSGHLPFARALVHLMRPRVFVELGTHTGNSFCAFCDSVIADELDTRCYAVDTWEGDPQAGYYGSRAYTELANYVGANYAPFAQLLRTTFDEAVHQFDDDTIDLLHIDGLHSYEAVLNDFNTWNRKLSPQGVVLFHDTRVFDRGFGVHLVWEQLRKEFKGFEFVHSHGLGMLLVGCDVAQPVKEFVELASDYPEPILELFERIALADLSSDAISYQRRFAGKPSIETWSLYCELFLDRGKGFSENEKLIDNLTLDQSKGLIQFELKNFSEGLSRVRFDPGNEPIALDRVSTRWRDDKGIWRDLKWAACSAISNDGIMLFGKDPWIEFILPDHSKIVALEIEINVLAAGTQLNAVLIDHVEAITQLNAQLEAQRDSLMMSAGTEAGYTEANNIYCELFLDLGRGFNEDEKLIDNLSLVQNKGLIQFELQDFSEHLSRLRFDPGNEPIALDRVSTRWRDDKGIWRDIEWAACSAISSDGIMLFGKDPWLEFILPDHSKITLLEIEISVVAAGV